jgi:putative transcriptional regulator
MSKTATDQTTHAAPATPVEATTETEMARTRSVSGVKTLRRALGLTQQEFAARYRIPVGTLRDWEQGRTEPDQPARAYIKVIASNPEWVSRALAGESR